MSFGRTSRVHTNHPTAGDDQHDHEPLEDRDVVAEFFPAFAEQGAAADEGEVPHEAAGDRSRA